MSLLSRIDEVSGSYKARNAWLTFAIVLFIAIIVIPAIFVVTKLFTEWDLVSGVLNDSASMDVIEGAVWNSFSIALIVTIVDILVGLPMAWIMVRRDFKGKKWLDTLLDMPLAFPTAVLGISVVMFWGAPEGTTVYYTFYDLGIDYINSDRPEVSGKFAGKCARGIHVETKTSL